MNSAGQSNQSHFANVPGPTIQRSTFDRSFTHKTTFDSGYLYPFFADEVLPGDVMHLTTTMLARLATPIFPYMDNLTLDVHFWFVPNRLVWSNWEKFMGAQDNPADSISYLVPQLDAPTYTAAGFLTGSLHDYFGLPTKITGVIQADMPNALLFRSYNLIWNTWYRDENLQNGLTVQLTDGPDATAYALQKRGRRKDYFTSALPWAQKWGAVSLPLGSLAPIKYQNVSGTSATGTFANTFQNAGGVGNATKAATFGAVGAGIGNSTELALYADLTGATAATINDIRAAVTLQQFYERDARGGSRYVELLYSHFGVVSPDFRLQRPEYLGGGSSAINVNPIAQASGTGASGTTSPQGNLAAFAMTRMQGGFNHSFVEHGHVIGLMSVRADNTYQQGLNRSWSRRTRMDFAWPDFANLGEMVIKNKEMLLTGVTANDNATWGYQEQYADYRYKPSIVTGLMRSNAVGTLHSWHLAMDQAGTLATLAGLIPESPPVARIVAVPSQPQFILDSFTGLKHTRALPTYSVPGISRF